MHWGPSATFATLRHRARLLAAAREYFTSRGLLEVETPALVSHAVTDPHLQNITARLGNGRQLFLHTSPEFHMKRLLAAGAPDIWQLCKVFRDGEAGRRHEPEFTMLEWYRRSFTLDQLASETCDLLLALARAIGDPGTGIASASPVYWDYGNLFNRALGIDPLTTGCEALKACARETLGRDAMTSLESTLGNERSLWLDLLMSHAISQHLGKTEIAVVTGYPADQAALARLDPGNRHLAERFEVFCRGIEVANGYRELTDAAEQRRRFAADRDFRGRLGRADVEPDPHLLAAMESGLPDCAGVAVGFDRVVMLLLGLPTLQATLSFPILEG